MAAQLSFEAANAPGKHGSRTRSGFLALADVSAETFGRENEKDQHEQHRHP
jgi:hypothetical protein